MNPSKTTSVFKTDPPQLDKQEIADIARKYYGISGAQTALVSERDQNVKLATCTGSCVLKIANAAEDRAILELQNRAMIHLGQYKGVSLAPRVIRGRDGNTIYQYER